MVAAGACYCVVSGRRVQAGGLASINRAPLMRVNVQGEPVAPSDLQQENTKWR